VWLLGREIFLKLLKKKHDKKMEYKVKKHFIIRPIETFLTKSYPGITSEQEEMLANKRYYNFSEVDDFKLMAEFMSIYRHVPGIKELVKDIVEEHYHMTKNVDQNLHYLWHLYNHGTKAGEYRPFILLAEIQLLKALDYITEDEAHNMSNMMQSEDTDNLNLVYLSILNLRKKRIKEHGEFDKNACSVELNKIRQDYAYTILSVDLFTKAFTKKL
jgi:sulfur relay (sulfurtransferase) DsrC/TusE family protein